jgi:hypothetical protein
MYTFTADLSRIQDPLRAMMYEGGLFWATRAQQGRDLPQALG